MATVKNYSLRDYPDGVLPITSTDAPVNAKGDLFGFDTAGTRLPVGSDGQILVADSSSALGLKYSTPIGSTIGVTTGLDRNRPSATQGNIYLSTDTLQQYCSDSTKWYVVGKGSDRCTFDSYIGGFSDTNYFNSPTGIANAPSMVNPYTIACAFYVVSLPGVAGGILCSYGSGNITAGWVFGNSLVNANKIRLLMVGLGTLELNMTLTVGYHSFAFNYNGTNVRYVLDGGTVASIAAPGVYTAPDNSSLCAVGRYFGAGGFSAGWARFGWLQGYASVLSDADMQTLTGNNANYIPGRISTGPSYDFQTRWMPDGGFASGAQAFPAYGSASSKTTNLACAGGGLYKVVY